MGKDEALARAAAIKDTESRCSVRQHVNSHNDAVQCAQEHPQVHCILCAGTLCYKTWEAIRNN